MQRADIRVSGEAVGELCVYYLERRPQAGEGPFLKEERQLLDTLADHVGLFLLQRSRVVERRADAGVAGAGMERGLSMNREQVRNASKITLHSCLVFCTNPASEKPHIAQ